MENNRILMESFKAFGKTGPFPGKSWNFDEKLQIFENTETFPEKSWNINDEILAEIPGQITSYMTTKGITPAMVPRPPEEDEDEENMEFGTINDDPNLISN